jgi:hypothetical protein
MAGYQSERIQSKRDILPRKLRMRVIRLFAGTLTVENGVMWEYGF